MIRNVLKKIYESSSIGYFAVLPFYRFINFIKYDTRSDKHIINERYKKNFGVDINFNNPQTLNEKISWLKLHDRSPLHTLCSDKYAVREYVKEKIGAQYLVPLFFKSENYKDIIPENIPDTPSIIKTNHDSGGGIFVTDKSKINFPKIQLELRRRMGLNYYQRSKEWQYKNIAPCIIVEKLLQNKNGEIPMDYKLHCFNGIVRMISVDINRGSENHKRNWYDTNWKREPYKWSSPKGNGKFTDPADYEVPKPDTLEDMIKMSEILANPFAYVRVDWYDVDGQLFFGEITYYHDGGNKPILPHEWDLKLGSQLMLNRKNA